jgi:FkbM family methyltransferase
MSKGWRNFYQKSYSQALKLIAQTATQLIGRGAGKLAPWLPIGQTYLVDQYCGEFKFNIDTTYPMEGTVWLGGIYDRQTTKFLQTTLRSDDVFLDIGANCGALTLVAASVIKTGQIYAFEAAPTMQARLQQNLTSNPGLADRVHLVPIGLGETRGQLFYQEDPEFRGNGSLFNDGDLANAIAVEIITLDEWIATKIIPPVNVIKIDVEGMEYSVLQGARNLLERDHPLIYFESMPNNLVGKAHTIADVYQYLSNFGYEILDPQQPTKVLDWQHPPDNSVAIYGRKHNRLNRS